LGGASTGEVDEEVAKWGGGDPVENLSASPVLFLSKMDEEASDK